MPPEALGGGTFEPVGDVRDRQPPVFHQLGRVKNPDRGQVSLGRGQPRPGKPGHQRAGADSEGPSEPANGRGGWRHPNDRVDEVAPFPMEFGKPVEQGAEDPGGVAGRGLGHQVAEPPPAGRLGDVHHVPDAQCAQSQECGQRFGVMAADQRHGREGREGSHQPADGHARGWVASVHRNEDRVDRALSHRRDRLRHRLPTQDPETPLSSGFDPGPLGGEQYRGNGRRALAGNGHSRSPVRRSSRRMGVRHQPPLNWSWVRKRGPLADLVQPRARPDRLCRYGPAPRSAGHRRPALLTVYSTGR